MGENVYLFEIIGSPRSGEYLIDLTELGRNRDRQDYSYRDVIEHGFPDLDLDAIEEVCRDVKREGRVDMIKVPLDSRFTWSRGNLFTADISDSVKIFMEPLTEQPSESEIELEDGCSTESDAE